MSRKTMAQKLFPKKKQPRPKLKVVARDGQIVTDLTDPYQLNLF